VCGEKKIDREYAMAVQGAQQRINEAVAGWPGVTLHPHRFGGTEYRLGRRELGHIHGDYLVDIPFPTKVRAEIVAAGRARPHHVLPDSGWISFYLKELADVEKAIGLLQYSFELARKQRERRQGTEPGELEP
jgi:Luciferase